MPSYTPFERTVRTLKEQGLLDEGNKLTPAGHDWCRALMTRLDDTAQRNWETIRRKQEQQEQDIGEDYELDAAD